MQLNILFREWLHRRKITDAVIERSGIHGDTEIVVPIHNPDGSFAFNKYRRNPLKDSGPKYWYDKGGKVTLFGADVIAEANDVVITEGEMDTLVCLSHNIPAVSSTGGALSFQEEWLSLFSGKRMIICFDNDPTGGDGMARLFEMTKKSGIETAFIFLPDRPGVKDISDYVTSGGDLHALLSTAKVFPDEQAVRNDMAARNALWKSIHFHEAIMRRVEDRRRREIRVSDGMPRKDLPEGDVERAKAFPIDEIIEFRQGKTRCIWHAEKTGSLHYFMKENRVFCFGCRKGGDAIDVYMTKNGVTFKEAVKALTK